MESIIARALEYTLKYWLKSFSRDQFKLQGRTVQLSNLGTFFFFFLNFVISSILEVFTCLMGGGGGGRVCVLNVNWRQVMWWIGWDFRVLSFGYEKNVRFDW